MKGKWLDVAAVATLVGAVAALYARTAGFGFLRLDDFGYTCGCPFVAGGLTWANIGEAFSRIAYGGIWMPLTYISYMADITLRGGSWATHHATNTALHAANAAMLYFFAKKAACASPRADCASAGNGCRDTRAFAAFACALFWALHPQRVEAVAWIASRKEELWTLFTLAGLMAWGSGRRLAGVVCCLAACLSKPTAVCFPVLAWIVENSAGGDAAAPIGRLRKLAWYIPLVLASAVTGLAAIGAQTRPEGMAEVAVLHIPLVERAFNAASSLGMLAGRFLFPAGTHFDYLEPSIVAKAAGLAILAACASALVWKARMRFDAPVPRLCLMAIVAWLPVSGIAGSFGEYPLADRFFYLPGAFLCAALAAWAAERRARAAIVIAAAALFAVIAWPVVSSYRNDATAFERALSFDRRHWRALSHVGAAYATQPGRMDEGIALLRRSYAISPRATTLETLAYTLACRGKEGDAAEILRLAARYIREPSRDARGMIAEALGIAFLQSSRTADAIRCLQASLRAPQRFYKTDEARFRLAEAYRRCGDTAKARSMLRPLAIDENRAVRLRALEELSKL